MISGNPVPSLLFESLVRDVETLCRSHQLVLTFFEFLTAVAFLAFSQSECQVLVLEAGLGGALGCNDGRQPASDSADPGRTGP